MTKTILKKFIHIQTQISKTEIFFLLFFFQHQKFHQEYLHKDIWSLLKKKWTSPLSIQNFNEGVIITSKMSLRITHNVREREFCLSFYKHIYIILILIKTRYSLHIFLFRNHLSALHFFSFLLHVISNNY